EELRLPRPVGRQRLPDRHAQHAARSRARLRGARPHGLREPAVRRGRRAPRAHVLDRMGPLPVDAAGAGGRALRGEPPLRGSGARDREAERTEPGRRRAPGRRQADGGGTVDRGSGRRSAPRREHRRASARRLTCIFPRLVMAEGDDKRKTGVLLTVVAAALAVAVWLWVGGRSSAPSAAPVVEAAPPPEPTRAP